MSAARALPAMKAPPPLTEAPNLSRGAVRNPLLTVAPRAFVIHGKRGRVRLVMVVEVCPFCSAAHVHSAGLVFAEGRRTAGCRMGRYLVRVGAVQGEVAA